mmetsp:Transcript_114/g.296  ORF Transcript_114/g.296 Transcript_114/m.296 type:complete len:310 (+) Transcript_114:203-1132(+)
MRLWLSGRSHTLTRCILAVEECAALLGQQAHASLCARHHRVVRQRTEYPRSCTGFALRSRVSFHRVARSSVAVPARARAEVPPGRACPESGAAGAAGAAASWAGNRGRICLSLVFLALGGLALLRLVLALALLGVGAPRGALPDPLATAPAVLHPVLCTFLPRTVAEVVVRLRQRRLLVAFILLDDLALLAPGQRRGRGLRLRRRQLAGRLGTIAPRTAGLLIGRLPGSRAARHLPALRVDEAGELLVVLNAHGHRRRRRRACLLPWARISRGRGERQEGLDGMLCAWSLRTQRPDQGRVEVREHALEV